MVDHERADAVPSGGRTAAASPDELAFVEDIALFFEHEGLPRMVGRVIGWLLICDPPEQSPAELAAVLQASRSSISSATRMLTPSGLIKRVAKPGERQDYFRIDANAWAGMLRRRAAQTTDFRKLTGRGLELLEGASGRRRERLANVHELYEFLEQRLPAIFDEWAAQQRGSGR